MYYAAPTAPTQKTDSYEVSVFPLKERKRGVVSITLNEGGRTLNRPPLRFTDKDTSVNRNPNLLSVPHLLRYCPAAEEYRVKGGGRTLLLYVRQRQEATAEEGELRADLIEDTEQLLRQLDISIDLHDCVQPDFLARIRD